MQMAGCVVGFISGGECVSNVSSGNNWCLREKKREINGDGMRVGIWYAWEQRQSYKRQNSPDITAFCLFPPSDCLAFISALILLTSPVTNNQDISSSGATVKQLYKLLQQRGPWSELIKHNGALLPACSSGHCLVRKTFIIMPTAAISPLVSAPMKVMAINNLTHCLAYKNHTGEGGRTDGFLWLFRQNARTDLVCLPLWEKTQEHTEKL